MGSTKASVQGLELAKANRLKQIWDSWKQFPGRAPNGTGVTGLTSSDAKGYSDMLNEQVEGMNLENEMNGDAPVRVRRGFDLPSQTSHGIADDPTSSFNTTTGPYGAFGTGPAIEGPLGPLDPAQQLAKMSGKNKPLPETHDVFMTGLKKKFGAR